MSAGAEGAAAPSYDDRDLVLTREEPAATHAPEPVPEEGGFEPEPTRGRGALAAILIILALGWAALWSVAFVQGLDGANLQGIVQGIATLCIPLALLALLWLLFGRTRRTETERFSRAVSRMEAEVRSLDVALGIVAERLSANRAQLGEESARLMRLGEEASDRLGRVTHYLSRETADLDSTAKAVEAAAAQARVDVGVLLTDLPQAEHSARSFSETVREAGVTAHERARALEAQLSAIAARAQDADAATGGAAERLSAHIARIQSSAAVASEELDGAAVRLDAAVDAALGRTSEAVEATRAALDAQAEGLFASIEQSRARFSESGAEAERQMTERLAAIRTAFDGHVDAMLAAIEEGRAHFAQAGGEADRDMAARLATLRGGFDDHVRAIMEAVDEARARLSEAGAESGRALTERLDAAQAMVYRIGSGLAHQHERSEELVGGLAAQIASLDERLAALSQSAEGQSAQMGTALADLRESAAALRQEVDAGTQEAAALIGRTNDMAAAIEQVGARLRSDLPAALSEAEAQAAAMRETALSAAEPVEAIRAAASQGAERLAEAEQSIERQRGAIEDLLAGIAGRAEEVEQQLRGLSAAANQADDSASVLVRETGPELVEALVRVREAARVAGAHARDAIAAAIPEAASSLSEAAQRAVADSVTDAVRQQIAEMDETAQRAAGAARKASERLTRQMLALGEAASALEAKLEDERTRREEHDRDALPRRVALLIESLNSTAIDVTKILSNEVTDSAWQAYLKGDRGVFTRRAVRLLESGEAREIQRHYDQEPEFREQVNRYIADFEAMLARVLTDRDGNALAITLLSSDMGKLYVALAQAIQHLRV